MKVKSNFRLIYLHNFFTANYFCVHLITSCYLEFGVKMKVCCKSIIKMLRR